MNNKTAKEIVKISIELLSKKKFNIKQIVRAICELYPDKKQTSKIAYAGIEIYQSLDLAVYQAGGSRFSINELNEMSAFDLLTKLSTNHIIFTYNDCYKQQEESGV